MKILFFLVMLINFIVFMWEVKHGAFKQVVDNAPQLEQILLVSELPVTKEPTIVVNFKSLYPPGLDPLAGNFLTDRPSIEDFTDEFLFFPKNQTKAISP